MLVQFFTFCCLLAATLHRLIVVSLSPGCLHNCLFSFSHRLNIFAACTPVTDACTATPVDCCCCCCCCFPFHTSACLIAFPLLLLTCNRLIVVVILPLVPFSPSACMAMQHSSPPSACTISFGLLLACGHCDMQAG